MTKMDANQVLKSSFSEVDGALRTVPGAATSFAVELDANDGDSVETRPMNSGVQTLLSSVSAAVSSNSSVVNVLQYSSGGFVISWSGVTGALNGTVSYQYSFDDILWVDSGIVVNISSASGQAYQNLNPLNIKSVRLSYTANGNTGGTISSQYVLKG